MKRLFLAVCAAAALWACTWLWLSVSLKTSVENWFEQRRVDGWTAEHGGISVRGFPNRLDVTLTDLVLADPDSGSVWTSPFLQIFRLVYQPGHHIVAFADRQTLTHKGVVHELDAQGMRASVISDVDGRILRINLESETLNLSGPQRSVALAGLSAATSRGETPERYLLGLTIHRLAGSTTAGIPSDASAVTLRSVVDFDTPLRLVPDKTRPQIRRIDLRLAELQAHSLTLKATGSVDVNAKSQPTGTINLRADNWREGLAKAKSAKDLPEWLVDLAENALGALAILGNGTSLDVTLRLDKGKAWLGILPVGTVPDLRLP